MKNQILILLCLLVTVCGLQAQGNAPTKQEIEMKVNFLGYRFYKNGERLTWKELVNATESVEEANQLIKRAKSQNTIANVLAFTSGAAFGIVLAQELNDFDPTWELAYVSGGLLIVGFHLSFRAFNNVNKGVDTYNIAVAPKTGYQFQPGFSIINNRNGLGLMVRF